MVINWRKSIRTKTPLQMTIFERQLDNLHQRTGSRKPRSINNSRSHNMSVFCGQVSLSLRPTADAADQTATDVDPFEKLAYLCIRCKPPLSLPDAAAFELHLSTVHYAIESVYVKAEPTDEPRPPLIAKPVKAESNL